MTDKHTPLDSTLNRTLGSAALTPEQRRRHLERIAGRAERGRFNAPRLLRDGAVLAVLIALLAGAWMLLPLGESSDSEIDPETAIASFLESVAELEGPEGPRFRQMTSETFLYAHSRLEDIHVWDRFNESGVLERSIMIYDDEGNLQGRTVEFEDRTVFELPGFWDEADAGTLLTPPELGPALITVHFSEAGDFQNQLDEILAMEDVDVEMHDGLLIIRARASNDFTDDEFASLSEQLGFTATAAIMENVLDPDHAQRVGWRFAVEDEHGDVHEVQRIDFGRWETIDLSDIPENAFAERTALSEEEIGPPMPDQIETSLGTLEIRDIEMRSTLFGTVTYLGPAPLLIEVQFSQQLEPFDTDYPDAFPIEIPGIEGYWTADPMREGWPRGTVWVDDGIRFNLRARNLPEGGWTVDDLHEVIQAIVDHTPD